jgi:hypothetical protein
VHGSATLGPDEGSSPVVTPKRPQTLSRALPLGLGIMSWRLESDTIIGDLIERACNASELKLLLLKAALASRAVYDDGQGGKTVDCTRVL